MFEFSSPLEHLLFMRGRTNSPSNFKIWVGRLIFSTDLPLSSKSETKFPLMPNCGSFHRSNCTAIILDILCHGHEVTCRRLLSTVCLLWPTFTWHRINVSIINVDAMYKPPKQYRD